MRGSRSAGGFARNDAIHVIPFLHCRGARRGLYHASAYKGIENMKVQALCEKEPDRLEAGVKQLGVP